MTLDEAKGVGRKFGRPLPAGLKRMALSLDFMNAAVLEAALKADDYPKHPSGKLTDEKKSQYSQELLAYLQDLAKSMGATVVDAAEPPERPAVGPSRRSVPAPAGMVRLTVNVPQELHTRLRMKSLELGTTLTEMVVEWAKGVVGGGA